MLTGSTGHLFSLLALWRWPTSLQTSKNRATQWTWIASAEYLATFKRIEWISNQSGKRWKDTRKILSLIFRKPWLVPSLGAVILAPIMTIIGPKSPSRWGSTFRPILVATIATLRSQQRKAQTKKFKSSVFSARWRLLSKLPTIKLRDWHWGEAQASSAFSVWQDSAFSWCGETGIRGIDRSLPAETILQPEERKWHKHLPRQQPHQWSQPSLRSRKPPNLLPVCLCCRWNHREPWPKMLQTGPRTS